MTMFLSFGEPIEALVVGANGGLGQAFVAALQADSNVQTVNAWSRNTPIVSDDKIITRTVAPDNEAQLAAAMRQLGQLSLVIVATGALHNDAGLQPEKSRNAIDPAQMAESYRINTIIPALIAKHALAKLPRRGKAVFCVLSARVGSITDNQLGGWYSYRASKAALNQIVKCLGIELGRTHPEAVCIGLHPGTVDTALSRPFQPSLAADHHLFQPAESVDRMLRVIDASTSVQSGSLLAWDGSIIPA